jgi:hypothetical protein
MVRTIFFAVICFSTLLFNSSILHAQESELIQAMTSRLYVIEKQNGAKFVGEIITQDAREILLLTKERGSIYIPQHEIRSIKEIVPENEKNFISDDLFSTRYFITTNGLPIKKGENYIQWNIYGPDFQFGIADNFGVGIMTSWAAIPIIGNAKYSINLGKNKSMALGLLAGTGSWALPEFGLLLPFASFTIGDRRNNLTFSTGYGAIFYEESEYNPTNYNSREYTDNELRFLVSIAGIAKITDKFSLVFDSFVSPIGPYKTRTEWEYKGYWDNESQISVDKWEKKEITERSPNLALILPGIRWQIDSDRAFQFGFTGFYFDNEFIPFPVPMVQWYRRL